MNLIGPTQIAELLGITRAGAHKLISRENGFPPPLTGVGNRRFWDRGTVERWAVANGRICAMHKRFKIVARMPAHGGIVGYCDDCVPYDVPQSFIPGDPGPNAKAPTIPLDLGLENYRG